MKKVDVFDPLDRSTEGIQLREFMFVAFLNNNNLLAFLNNFLLLIDRPYSHRLEYSKRSFAPPPGRVVSSSIDHLLLRNFLPCAVWRDSECEEKKV